MTPQHLSAVAAAACAQLISRKNVYNGTHKFAFNMPKKGAAGGVHLPSRSAPLGVCAINEANEGGRRQANPLLAHILNLQAELGTIRAIFWANSSGFSCVYFCLAKNKLKLFHVDAGNGVNGEGGEPGP